MRLLLVVVPALLAAAVLWLTVTTAPDEHVDATLPAGPSTLRPAVEPSAPAVSSALRSRASPAPTPAADSDASTSPEAADAELEPAVEELAPDDPDLLVVIGRVVDGAGVPVPGASVLVQLAVGIDRATLAETESDLDGRFRYESQYSLVLRQAQREVRRDAVARERRQPRGGRVGQGRGRPNESERLRGERDDSVKGGRPAPPGALMVLAERPGFRIGQARSDLPRETPHHVDVEIVLLPGATLVGRVVAEELPVPGAEIALVADDFTVLDRTLATPEGWWFLGVPEQGIVRVFARKTGWGTGFLEHPDLLSPTSPTHTIDLAGPGRITGRVVYPDGGAAEGVLLALEHEELCFTGEVGEARRIAFEQGRGLSNAMVLSQPSGEFDFQGLQAGRYRIQFATLGAGGPQPAELFATGEARIELVYAAHRLRVELDAEDFDLEQARVSCAPLERDEQGQLVPGIEHPAEGLSGRLFAVEPGRDYVVRVTAPGAYTQETVVLVPFQPFETRIDFELFAEDVEPELVERVLRRMHSGRVVIDAHGPAGERAGGWTVTLTSATPGLAFAQLRGVAADAEGRLPEVPAGVWQLTARPVPEAEGWLAPVSAPIEVVVRSGTDTRVEIRAQLGGRLRLALAPELASGSTRLDPADALVLRHGLTAKVRRADDEQSAWTPLVFFAPSETSASDGERLLPGHAATCDPALEPGAWQLRLESPAGAPREQRVEIKARETARVTVGP